MKIRVRLFLQSFVTVVLLFILVKPLFMFYYHSRFSDVGMGEVMQVMYHGLPLDFSVAGYVCTVIGLLLLASVFYAGRWLRRIAWMYAGMVSFCLSLVFVVNLGLYEYWGFPLDATPLFYFLSSPADAMASATPLIMLLGVLSVAIVFVVFLLSFYWALLRNFPTSVPESKKWKPALVLLLLSAALFLPIRGGVTVSTMNVGKVYFSNETILNHAAVNPVFSLMESMSKQKDFALQYRFMDEKEAERLYSQLLPDTISDAGTEEILTMERPDVVLIVLESFSSRLMASLGGEADVLPCLQKLADEGLLFTNFYANSFRTDRGLVSILSGYPAQPTTSIMKYPRKTQALPSIAGSLRAAGYTAQYYYGGDADFTNMRSYLISSGFQSIVADKDFPLSQRLSKWGVHDHVLTNRFFDDWSKLPAGDAQSHFFVVQTSSSHEPFDVPFCRHADERLNAFAYTDSVVGNLVKKMKTSPRWERTLLVIVPDHQGCWPQGIDNFIPQKFQIPLVLTGGALRKKGHFDKYGSQVDIAATLLSQLHLPHEAFHFSKNLFNPQVRGFAFFTIPDAFGIATAESTVIFDNETQKTVFRKGSHPDALLPYGKAFLQKLYDDLAAR